MSALFVFVDRVDFCCGQVSIDDQWISIGVLKKGWGETEPFRYSDAELAAFRRRLRWRPPPIPPYAPLSVTFAALELHGWDDDED